MSLNRFIRYHSIYDLDHIGNCPRDVSQHKCPVNEIDPSLFLIEIAFVSIFTLCLEKKHDLACLPDEPEVNQERCCDSFPEVQAQEVIVNLGFKEFVPVAQIVFDDILMYNDHVGDVKSSVYNAAKKGVDQDAPLLCLEVFQHFLFCLRRAVEVGLDELLRILEQALQLDREDCQGATLAEAEDKVCIRNSVGNQQPIQLTVVRVRGDARRHYY